jgi:hypothetical protein
VAQTEIYHPLKKIETNAIDSQSSFRPRSSASIQYPAENARTPFPALPGRSSVVSTATSMDASNVFSRSLLSFMVHIQYKPV